MEHTRNILVQARLEKTLREELTEKFFVRLSLLDVEISLEAALKIDELCANATFNMRCENQDGFNKNRVDDSIDALVLTILDNMVAYAREGIPKNSFVIEAQAIEKALAALSPLFPFCP